MYKMKLYGVVCAAIFVIFIDDINSALPGVKCPAPKLENGRGRLTTKKGHAARFKCNQTFQLFGEKYATCIRGRWDHIPICVKPGCDVPSSMFNGQIFESYKRAVLKLVCNPGYFLEGSPIVYCNGVKWNTTIPQCKASERMAQTWCDFESQDLCGWTQDPNHHFDWTRQNLQTPSGNVGTGPSYDHTLGSDKSGYYMYIESSSPRMENDKARLFSPVYNPELTRNQSCFVFWYHMFGATTGSLNVFVKPESAEFDGTLLPRFTKSGDQGNEWYQAIIWLPTINESFQVVIEGVRGAGYVSDIAIDDVKITNGSECLIPVKNVSFVTASVSDNDEGNDIYDNTQSCRLRCNGDNSLTRTTPNYPECDCDAGCLQRGSCCPDYTSYCLLELPKNQSTVLQISNATTVRIPISAASTDISNQPVEVATIPTIQYKPIRFSIDTEMQPDTENIPVATEPTSSFSKMYTLTYLPNRTETAAPAKTSKQKTTSLLTSGRESPASATTSYSQSTVRTNVFNVIFAATSTLIPQTTTSATSYFTTRKPVTIVNTTITSVTPTRQVVFRPTRKFPIKLVTEKPLRQNNFTTTIRQPRTKTTATTRTTAATTRTPAIIKTTRTTAATTIKTTRRTTAATTIKTTRTKAAAIKTTTTTTTPKPTTEKPTTAKPTTLDIIETSLYPIFPMTRETWVRDAKWREARNGPPPKEKIGPSLSTIAGALVAVVLVIAAIGFAAFLFARKRRHERMQNYMSEDSDVRFLTSDEALDFCLARPCEDDL